MEIRTIGRYEIVREVGRGGMGIVYGARDPYLDRRVAVKVLPAELTFDQHFVERFLREGQTAACLSHPNVVTVYEAGEADRQYYLVMEYVPGTDLAQLLREKGSLDPEKVLEMLEQVAAGLDAAHAQGIVHRDIKPGNILIDPRGSVKVTDFGVARAYDRGGGTRTGGVIGTAEYMSPEQALGNPVDARSDVYALGCVAYEALTGVPPFGRVTADRSAISIIHDHAHRRPPSLRSACAELPRALDTVLTRALDKLPERRYATAGEFAAALRTAAATSPPNSRRKGASVPPSESGPGKAAELPRLPASGIDTLSPRSSRARLPLGPSVVLPGAALLAGCLIMALGGQRQTGGVPPPPKEGFFQVQVPAGVELAALGVTVLQGSHIVRAPGGRLLDQASVSELAATGLPPGAYRLWFTYRRRLLADIPAEVHPGDRSPVQPSRKELAAIEYETAIGAQGTPAEIAHFRRVLLLDPRHVDAHLQLAAYELLHGPVERVERHLQAVHRVDPQNAAAAEIARLLHNRKAREK